MLLTFFWILALAGLVAVSSVASYLRLLMRRLSGVGARKLFQGNQGRAIRADRERVGVSVSTLHGAAMAVFAVGLTGLFFLRRPGHSWANLSAALLVILCVIAICDQLIPFLLVARHDEPEQILAEWMPVLRLSVFLALPLTFPILVSTGLQRLLEAQDPQPEEPSPQEDLQELIEAGEKEGIIEKGQGELLQSVVEFGDKVVREVMTPRPEIAAIEINSTMEELRKLFREKRYTRYLVYAGQLNNVEGIVSIRDLTELPPAEQSRVTLRSLLRPVPFVPETKRTAELLKELQQSTTQLAVVVDEYGSVAGLVTIEDLVEEIVGEIRDEVEPHARDILRESANTYLIAGQTELAQVTDQLNVAIEEGEYSTIAGFLLARLGHVPAPGEKVETDGLSFEVLEADPRTVLKVRLRLPPRSSSASPA